MDNRRGRWSCLPFLVFATGAGVLGLNAIYAQNSPDGQIQGTSTSVVPLPTETPFPLPYDVDLLIDGARPTAMMATAQSVLSKGESRLVAEGFPIEVMRSQVITKKKYEMEIVVNGISENRELQYNSNSTVVDLPEMGAFLLVESWHTSSVDYVNRVELEAEKQRSPGSEISISWIKQKSLAIEGITELDGSLFGIETFYDADSDDGLGIVFIPKQGIRNLDPSLLATLESRALKMDDLWFDEVPESVKFVGYCNPSDTGGLPVVIENGVAVPDKSKILTVYPYLVGHGCSSSGIFFVTLDNQVKLEAVLIGHDSTNAHWNKSVGGFKLSNVGQVGFMYLVNQVNANLAAK